MRMCAAFSVAVLVINALILQILKQWFNFTQIYTKILKENKKLKGALQEHFREHIVRNSHENVKNTIFSMEA